MPSRARSFTLPPRSTSITEPWTTEPAGIATRSPTRTSRVTRASTRSSTRAVSLEIVRSICRPITASAGTTSSTSSGAAGGGGVSGSGSTTGARSGVTVGRVSHIPPPVGAGAAAGTLSVAAGSVRAVRRGGSLVAGAFERGDASLPLCGLVMTRLGRAAVSRRGTTGASVDRRRRGRDFRRSRRRDDALGFRDRFCRARTRRVLRPEPQSQRRPAPEIDGRPGNHRRLLPPCNPGRDRRRRAC